MNKKRVFVILAVITLVLGACFSPWKGDEGTFSVNIGGGDRAAAWNDTKILENLAHTITLSDGPGPGQTRPNIKYGSTVHFSVTPGRWTITITASLDGEEYAAGFDVLTIKPGRNGAFSIKMTPINSGGSEEPGEPEEPEVTVDAAFEITFDQIQGIEPLPHQTIVLNPNNTTYIVRVNDEYAGVNWYVNGITGKGVSFMLKKADFSPGDYTLTVEVVTLAGEYYSQTIQFTVTN